MDWGKKNVLVTGGGGFLGRYIVERLLALNCNHIVTLGRSPQPELTTAGVKVICGDIADSDSVNEAAEDCDLVFHTAAKAGIWGKYRDFQRTNIQGTENVISACKKYRIPILVNTSSPSVIATEKNIENADESFPIPDTFLSHYPRTKAAAEKLVAEAASAELRTVSLRPHLIWGPRDPHILPRLFLRAAKKRLVRVGDGTNKVDLTYVENAAHAHILAAEMLDNKPELSAKTYFVSDDGPVVLWQWISDLLSRMNLPPITRNISYLRARRIAGVLETVFRLFALPGEPPMTRFVAAQLAHNHYFNITAAKRDLGYRPIIPTEKALEKTVAFFDNKQYNT